MPTSCSGGGKKKETKLGLAHSKADDFGGWYSEVCTESELISYYAVSGKSQLSLQLLLHCPYGWFCADEHFNELLTTSMLEYFI